MLSHCCCITRCTLSSHNAAAAAGLTAEEKAALEVQITAVKNACYDAVIKSVLHVHDTYIDRGYQLELDEVEIKDVISE